MKAAGGATCSCVCRPDMAAARLPPRGFYHPSPTSALCTTVLDELDKLALGKDILDYEHMYEWVTSLARCQRPFAHARYDHEVQLVMGKTYNPVKHTGEFHLGALAPHTFAYQEIRMDLMDSLEDLEHFRDPFEQHWNLTAQNATAEAMLRDAPHAPEDVDDQRFFYALPLPPCTEGLGAGEGGGAAPHPAGGDLADVVRLLGQLPYVDASHVSYSTLFSHQNFEKAEAFFEGLLTHRDNAYLVTLDHPDRLAVPWAAKVRAIPRDAVFNYHLRREGVAATLRALVTQCESFDCRATDAPPTVLVAAGVLGAGLIQIMHKANPRGLYVDVEGLLDRRLRGLQKRGEHHYTGVDRLHPKSTLDRSCTYSRYVRYQDCVAPVAAAAGAGVGRAPKLSPRCYVKGGKGEAVAPRVTRHFPSREHHDKNKARTYGDHIEVDREAKRSWENNEGYDLVDPHRK